MSAHVVLWTAIGVATGVTHAAALWRSTHACKTQGWSAAWRLPIVAAVLAFAALAHALPPTMAGWLAGLSAASVLYLTRTRRWT